VLHLQEQKLLAWRHRLYLFGQSLDATGPKIEQWLMRLTAALPRRLKMQEDRLASLQAQLHLVSPQAVLERGYAILSQDHIIRAPEDVDDSRAIDAQLARGKIRLRRIPE
jgi:exodeoxyribonuclease VII large subunit